MAFIFGLLYAPQLFHHNELLGALCREDNYPATWYVNEDGGSNPGGCTPVDLFQETSALKDLKISFRFPSEETKVKGFYLKVFKMQMLLNKEVLVMSSKRLTLANSLAATQY